MFLRCINYERIERKYKEKDAVATHSTFNLVKFLTDKHNVRHTFNRIFSQLSILIYCDIIC